MRPPPGGVVRRSCLRRQSRQTRLATFWAIPASGSRTRPRRTWRPSRSRRAAASNRSPDVGYTLSGGAREPQSPFRATTRSAARNRPRRPGRRRIGRRWRGRGARGHDPLPAGLHVVGLEAGPWRTSRDFVPDELGSAYYCRGGMGRKYLSETPRWRLQRATRRRAKPAFSLGRMMNGIGGSVIHWGGALRRNHPHHFKYRTYVRERSGRTGAARRAYAQRIGRSATTSWSPTTPELEYEIGVDQRRRAQSVPVTRSKPAPAPVHAPVRMGEVFRPGVRGPRPAPVPHAGGREQCVLQWLSGDELLCAGWAGSGRSTTSAGIPV